MIAASTALDPRTPVLVAVGQVEQRAEAPEDALEPAALLAEAVRTAVADSGSARLLDGIDTFAVVHVISHRYRDPAALAASLLGWDVARTVHADDGGNFPQTLVHRACAEILAGRSDGWLIGGAEAWRTRTAARADGRPLAWTVQGDDVEPTEHITNPESLAHPGEWARQLFLPTEIYPLFDNALRAAKGWTIDEQRDRIARIYARFSEVAEANPHAWIRQARTAAEIREPSATNRMVGFPYTKLVNANASVEQAACFAVVSVERARALGIAADRWVFPWVGTDAHEHWHVSNRWSLAEAPAARAAGRAALELAGIGLDDIGHIDLYSCFPSAVQVTAEELGLSIDRDLTVTGGLSFAGGPWNDYVSHSIATMVERLRDHPGDLGLIYANGGYLTKHAFGVYSTEPPPVAFRHAEPQAEVDRLPRRELAEDVDADAVVETSVVVHGRDGAPEKAVVSTILPDGRRAWGLTFDADAMARLVTVETAGDQAHVAADGTFTFA